MKRTLAGVAALLAAATVLSVAPTAQAQQTAVPRAGNGKAVTTHLRDAIDHLPVAAEVRTGYERSKFKHWDDADHDCQDTRSEVLRQETTKAVTGSCTVKTGRWVSQYDGLVFTQASKLDVDHLVPLAEAWDSGARTWSAARREAYANDLAEPRTLIAVSASSNRSKSDQDPAEWLPDRAVCQYVLQWTVVKVRWGLSVDTTEKSALRRLAAGCPDRRFTTHRAIVKNAGAGSGSSGSTGGSGGGGGLDPKFGTCKEAKAHGYGPYYEGRDPEYAWYRDSDGDGIVCE